MPRIWRVFAIWHIVFGTLGYAAIAAVIVCLLWGVARNSLHLPLPGTILRIDRAYIYFALGCFAILGLRQTVIDLRDLLQNGPGPVPVGLQVRVLWMNNAGTVNLFRMAGWLCFALISALVCLSKSTNVHVALFISLVLLQLAAIIVEVCLNEKIAKELRLDLWLGTRPLGR